MVVPRDGLLVLYLLTSIEQTICHIQYQECLLEKNIRSYQNTGRLYIQNTGARFPGGKKCSF